MIYPDPKPKTIRLSSTERNKLKLAIYRNRARGKCETCGKPVPLIQDGVWDQFTCAHLSHIKSRGAGGSDTKENCKIECWNCHSGSHGPRWGE